MNYRYKVNVLSFNSSTNFILFFIVYLIIYFCSLYELQISDQIFFLVLTVAFMTIPAQFDAKTIEDKWYDYWMKTIIFIRARS
jgi:hypothetical protein